MGGKIAECGAEGARTIGADFQKVLAIISIHAIHCFFTNCENHKYLKYLILLTAESSEKGGKIAECGAKDARVIRTDIWKVLATISRGGINCFFANCENHK